MLVVGLLLLELQDQVLGLHHRGAVVHLLAVADSLVGHGLRALLRLPVDQAGPGGAEGQRGDTV